MRTSAQQTASRRSHGAEMDFIRVLPHSIPSEHAVLGGILIENRAFDLAADKVSENDFYDPLNRRVYAAIRKLSEHQMPFDIVTVSETVAADHGNDKAEVLAYLASLVQETPGASNVATYAEIVQDRSLRRKLIREAGEIADAAYQCQIDLPEVLELAERKVFTLADNRGQAGEGFEHVKTVMDSVLDRMESLAGKDSEITGTPSGYTDLDRMTSGLHGGDLIILAGRPAMGKTSLGMGVAENIILESKLPVAVYSMEMPSEQLVMRMASSLARIEFTKLRNAKLDDDEWRRFTSVSNMLSNAPLFIDDTGGLTFSEVRTRSRRLSREHGQLGLIVVDYVQLMEAPDSSAGTNRSQEVSQISRGLKRLAKELNVPVIALAQLNRNLEQRPNKRPMPSDLKDSGGLEQDADIIMFIYRDEVYNPETCDRGIAEIIIAKHRNGPIGTVRLNFLGEFTRFENIAAEPNARWSAPE